MTWKKRLNEEITFLRIAIFFMLLLFILPTFGSIYIGLEEIQLRNEYGQALPQLNRVYEGSKEIINVGIAP